MSKSLRSIRGLAWRLDVKRRHLVQIAATAGGRYQEFSMPKASGFRLIHNPQVELKDIQRRINERLLKPIGFTDCAHGGVKGCSPRTNAALHGAQPCVVQLDVRECFPSMSNKMVYALFHEHLGFGADVSRLLTQLTTYQHSLPQGAPTSTSIANWLLGFEVDSTVLTEARARDIVYTRFVDDLFFSGAEPRPLINQAIAALASAGLRIKRQKLKIQPHHVRQEVTGLTVNRSRRPSVARYKRARVRAAIHELAQRDDPEKDELLRSIQGRIAHIKQTNVGEAARLQRQLSRLTVAGGKAPNPPAQKVPERCAGKLTEGFGEDLSE